MEGKNYTKEDLICFICLEMKLDVLETTCCRKIICQECLKGMTDMEGCSNECDKEFGTKHPGKIIINKIENFNQVCKKCGYETTFT